MRGMTATVSEQLHEWQQQPGTGGEMSMDGISPHPRIGIGLPMSNIYATYFGGSLELVSLDGYGECTRHLMAFSERLTLFRQGRMCSSSCQSWYVQMLTALRSCWVPC